MPRIYSMGGPIVAQPFKRVPASRGPDYKDTGCHLHPSCLNCPRPTCVYDTMPDSEEDELRWVKQQEIARRLAEGEPTVYIAAQTVVSIRTVQRRKVALGLARS